MMEPLAENCYTLTKPLFYEGMRPVLRQGYGKAVRWAVLALAAAWIALTAATLILKQSPAYLAAEASILGLAILWLMVYMPWHKARSAWKKMEERYGAYMERTTCFYDDHLTVCAAGREVTVPYEQIAKKLQTDHLLILIAQDQTGVLIKRDAFRKGNEAEIMKLIS